MNNIIHKDIIIIGSGITGLSLASYIQDKDYLILEGSDSIGGYCKTTKRSGYVWDYSGHFFHFKDESIKERLIRNIDCDVLKIKKISKIYHRGLFIDFPFQYNIHQLDKPEFINCLYELN